MHHFDNKEGANHERFYTNFGKEVSRDAEWYRCLHRKIHKIAAERFTQFSNKKKDLTLHKPLADIKMILWTKIGQSITYQWRSIETMYEQMELIDRAKEQISNTKGLGIIRKYAWSGQCTHPFFKHQY